MKTTDGFTTGSILDAGYSFDIVAIDETSYLSGKDATTLKISRDNGATWELSSNGIGSTFFELALFNHKVYALAAGGKAYISYLDFYNKPVLDFSYTLNDKVATFTNLSTNTKSYEWTFGDSQSSVEVLPSHTYVDYGTYSVTLNGGNLCWKGAAKRLHQHCPNRSGGERDEQLPYLAKSSNSGYVNLSLAMPSGNYHD